MAIDCSRDTHIGQLDGDTTLADVRRARRECGCLVCRHDLSMPATQTDATLSQYVTE